MMLSLRLAAPAATLLFSLNALAQTPADSSRSLREVTVYGTRLDQVAGQTGRYVTVVPGSALNRYPVTSLDDLLRFLPALEVQSRGSMGAQADITLRGSTFNQVLLLLDGSTPSAEFDDLVFEADFPRLGRRRVCLYGRRMLYQGQPTGRVLLGVRSLEEVG